MGQIQIETCSHAWSGTDRSLPCSGAPLAAMEEATAAAPAATATSASVPDGEDMTATDSGPRLRLDWHEAPMHGEYLPPPIARVLAAVAAHGRGRDSFSSCSYSGTCNIHWRSFGWASLGHGLPSKLGRFERPSNNLCINTTYLTIRFESRSV
jgi:hypothetical protein